MEELPLQRAEIITIGDELLYGQVADAHTPYLSAHLSERGLPVAFHTTVGDALDDIRTALTIAAARADLLLLTGGLGPTHDDRTKEALASFLNTNLEPSEEASAQVQAYRQQRGRTDAYPAVLSLLPRGAQPLRNRVGLAPGVWLQNAKQLFIALPGVPHEMKVIFEEEVLPRLHTHFSLSNTPRHAFVHTLGVPESILSKRLQAFERDMPPALTLAYLPEPGHVLLRLSLQPRFRPGPRPESRPDLKPTPKQSRIAHSASVKDPTTDSITDSITDSTTDSAASTKDSTHTTLLSREHAKLCTLLRDCAYSTAPKALPCEAVAVLLQRHKHTLALAESCTGGYLAHLFTQVAGASKHFLGAVVAYTPEAKYAHLGVKSSTVETKGVVSEETAKEMALGVRKRFSADWGLATTGLAGPSQGNSTRPVGTVWMACADAKGKVYARQHRFASDRYTHIRASAAYALALLKERLEATCTALHQNP